MTPNDPTVDPRRAPRSRFLALLGLLVALGPCTVDLYVPALPAVRSDLHASTAATQLTLTATTIGLAIGQLIAGPWSDSVGRRRPLLLGAVIHVIGSLGVAFAPDVTVMLVCRLVQGLGAAGSGVVAGAMIRDLFTGVAFVRASARLSIVTGLAPVVAPFLGSVLLTFVAWRGLFVVVAAYGVLAIVLSAFLLPETRPGGRTTATGGRGATDRYRTLLADRCFVGAALISGMVVSAVFTYMTSSSFLFQGKYGMTAQAYSVVFAVNALGFVAGSQTSSLLLRRYEPARVVAVALPSLTAIGLGVAASTLANAGPSSLIVLTVAFFIFAGACGPSLQLIAMTPHGQRAGTAAAALGSVSFGMAGITAPLAGIVGGASATPTGLVMGLTMGLATIVFRTLVLPRRSVTRRRSADALADILARSNSNFRDEVVESLHRVPVMPLLSAPEMQQTRDADATVTQLS